MTERMIRVGAVAYDPRVVTIWEGMRDYFREAGVPTDYVLFSNYEAQVAALLAGKHGDTGTSELEVLRALHEGRADAGMIGHAVWLQQLEQGAVNSALVRSVWTSPPYCHCNFTALPTFDGDLAARWTAALLAMD